AQEQGMDVAKIAVMPCSMEDIITLLSVSLEANNQLNIPVIVIAMGPYGVITRVAGGVFGSAVTFAVGHKASAPGQVPIDDLRAVLHTLEQSMKS
ncbi:MAG TPA: 3-dehydroquinate dehydratase, partial [Sporomusaceae bacterium]|nr:3-dehydroquinate dehydratase [Sporomusaceae bacterium]